MLHTYQSGNNPGSKKVALEKNTTYYFKVLMGKHETNSTGNYEVKVSSANGDTPNDPINKTLISISIASMPDKNEYAIGETLVTDGLKIAAKYSDGSSAYVNGYSVSGDDFSSAGEKTITVSYTENGVTRSCSFNVTVTENGDSSGGSSSDTSFMDYLLKAIEFLKTVFNFLIDLIMKVV